MLAVLEVLDLLEVLGYLRCLTGSLNPSGKRGTEDSFLIDSTSTVLDIGFLKNTKAFR